MSAKAEQAFKGFFKKRKWKPFPFQARMLEVYLQGYSGLLNAPTGFGKTYAMALPVLSDQISKDNGSKQGLRLMWISPIRSLAIEIETSVREACAELGMNWTVASRTGDTSSKDRANQRKNVPQVLVTTPESLHLMLARKNSKELFQTLQCIVCDEWHELLGTKRGVQVELALSRLKSLSPELRIWGISATIGNMDEAMDVLLGTDNSARKSIMVRAELKKKIEVKTIIPDELETLPWAGHLGTRLIEKVLPVIRKSKSTLLFTNTRSQAEIWYQKLLETNPELSGIMAMHHGSLGTEIRYWVEAALHEGRLKVVVCTSSLDMGVDFRPVQTVIQVGSPKGVARFVQRAGRSGHAPGEISRIYMLPTHALELVEAAALKHAVENAVFEARQPVLRAFDVLVQYLVTLAVGDGFRQEEILPEIRSTFAFSSVSDEEWEWALRFITQGGESLRAYEEFARVEVKDGLFLVNNRGIAMRHRMSIGTISGDSVMVITFLNGTRIGTIEEYFISRLNPGDVFTFAGKQLELVMVKGMQAVVRPSRKNKGIVPSWMGGRMPLSSQVSELMRNKLNEAVNGTSQDPEMKALEPLWEVQRRRSTIPGSGDLLIEDYNDQDGYHIFVFPFEGRLVHEGLGLLMAYRLARLMPLTFSVAMNDYGFELLTDVYFDIDMVDLTDIFSTADLVRDIIASTNYSELARRRFRDIALISGLMFKGYPNKVVKTKHLQASSALFFDVFSDYESNNLLLQQAYEEALYNQLETDRMRAALQRIQRQNIIIKHLEKPSPLSFPIMVDSMRERVSTEKLEDRIRKMMNDASE